MDKIVEILQGPEGPLIAAGALVTAAIVGGLVFLKVRSAVAVGRIAHRSRRGKRLEGQAARLLSAQGYSVLGEQVPAEIVLRIDGEKSRSTIHVDFIARKGGRLFAADAKSGAAVASPGRAEVRRQLLEYCIAFGCDRGLLVDMENRRVREVDFGATLSVRTGIGATGALLLAGLAGLAGLLTGWKFF